MKALALRSIGADASARLGEILEALADRGRALLGRRAPDEARGLIASASDLLSRRGEASGTAIAAALVARFESADEAELRSFLAALVDRFGPDRAAIERAIAAYTAAPSAQHAAALHVAAEPRRQELIRRINLAPGGTAALVRMRAALLRMRDDDPGFAAVDADFLHLFMSWFNRGFLMPRRIGWTTPINILEKIIRYEAVHAIRGWDDLRNRLEPPDRRCYGFFHPQLVDEPLIFVEVALTKSIPAAIGPLLDPARRAISADEADTAVFYSISNTQRGLAGVSFGNFLIKQVVEDLRRELPGLTRFVTLSPVPGFAAWLAKNPDADIPRAAARYFLYAKDLNGKPLDPVARFHLGNGARLERINPDGDPSERGMKQSKGLMVNYLYDLDAIEANHEAFAEAGTVMASAAIRRLAEGTK